MFLDLLLSVCDSLSRSGPLGLGLRVPGLRASGLKVLGFGALGSGVLGFALRLLAFMAQDFLV